MITNDPDEGILLADRIIPLTAGPGATLGPEIKIDLPRPRDRKAINHHHRFKEIRRDLITFMLDSKSERHTSITKKLILPDIEPEDLDRPPRIFSGRPKPKRAGEIKEETVEI